MNLRSNELLTYLPAMNSSTLWRERLTKLTSILSLFVRLNLVVLFMLMALRVSQYLVLSSRHSLPPYASLLEWHGFLQDMVLWLNVSWFLLIPFILLSWLRQNAGVAFFSLVFLILASTEWALFQYFAIALTPLDQVVFSYSVSELFFITGSSVPVNFFTFLPFILIFLFTALLSWLSLKVRISAWFFLPLFIPAFAVLFLVEEVTPREAEHRNSFEYYLTTNKSDYLVKKWRLYFLSSTNSATNASVEAAARRYQAAHPEFEFLGTQFPFLHVDKTPDVLGPMLNLGKEKPNLVFIIVESLSSCFMGKNSIYGSYTPFLDSLASKSLFWNNFLSTADRTFNVLPALFGSLPPGDPTFVNDVAKIPYHFSLIRDLRNNGYYTSFFYSGDPAFNYMGDFLQRQETDYILRSFGPEYKKGGARSDDYHWGYDDGDLYSRSFEVMDSMSRSPRLDIYLTLSLHAPFIPPNRDRYLAQVENRLKAMAADAPSREDVEHYKDIFATILYTDHALKEFIHQYSKRPEFTNTIFIITGDHGLPELNLFRFSGLARFHVPLIVFSPMVKKGTLMRSVSSHLDVTPSVLAMMREKYNITTHPRVPWMGSGIDTCTEPRNVHTLAMILNNKEIPEYVDHSFYLFREVMFRILPELWVKDTVDPVALNRMQMELADFKTLNTYVTRQNKLIPPEIYFGKGLDSINVVNTDTVKFTRVDTVKEFNSIFKHLRFDSRIKFLKMNLTFDLLTPETDTTKAPVLVFDYYGKDGKRLLWQAFSFPWHSLKPAKPDGWKTISLTEYVELSYLQKSSSDSLILYIWNRNRNILRLNNPKVRITGYY